jgi:hypothetical protein
VEEKTMNDFIRVGSEVPIGDAETGGMPVNESGQFECSNCERSADIDTGEELSTGERVCEACAEQFFRCASCEESTRSVNSKLAEDDHEICKECARQRYRYSSIQECYVRVEDAVELCDSGSVVSESWAERNAYASQDGCWYEDEDNVPRCIVHDYWDNVLEFCAYDKKSLDNGALVFGVELEMEPKGTSSQGDLVDALGGPTSTQFILKEDGSLDSGVEIVTVPLTLEGHLSTFGWPEVLSPLRGIAKSGARTHSCGMHVHINKAALTALQIGKMQVFLNCAAMRDQITLIAQRESNSYCERKIKKLTDGGAPSLNRHDIVNVGKRTVEIRMFRGNLRADRVLKNLEFCHALVMYSRDASLKFIELWSEFASWLLKRRSHYPHLVQFLAEKGEPRFAECGRAPKAKRQESITCA